MEKFDRNQWILFYRQNLVADNVKDSNILQRLLDGKASTLQVDNQRIVLIHHRSVANDKVIVDEASESWTRVRYEKVKVLI